MFVENVKVVVNSIRELIVGILFCAATGKTKKIIIVN